MPPGALNGLSYPFNSFHGWPHVDYSGAGGLVFFYSSAYLVSRYFYTLMQCDAIDTLVRADGPR